MLTQHIVISSAIVDHMGFRPVAQKIQAAPGFWTVAESSSRSKRPGSRGRQPKTWDCVMSSMVTPFWNFGIPGKKGHVFANGMGDDQLVVMTCLTYHSYE